MADGVVLAVMSVLALVAVASVVFALATDDRDPSIAPAWLFLILIVPLLGVVAYFFVGRNHLRPGRSRTRQRHRVVRATSERNLAATSESTRVFAEAAAKEIGDTPAGRVVAGRCAHGPGGRDGLPPRRQLPAVLRASCRWSAQPDVAIGLAGNVNVVFPTRTGIRFARRVAGHGWTAAHVIAPVHDEVPTRSRRDRSAASVPLVPGPTAHARPGTRPAADFGWLDEDGGIQVTRWPDADPSARSAPWSSRMTRGPQRSPNWTWTPVPAGTRSWWASRTPAACARSCGRVVGTGASSRCCEGPPAGPAFSSRCDPMAISTSPGRTTRLPASSGTAD